MSVWPTSQLCSFPKSSQNSAQCFGNTARDARAHAARSHMFAQTRLPMRQTATARSQPSRARKQQTVKVESFAVSVGRSVGPFAESISRTRRIVRRRSCAFHPVARACIFRAPATESGLKCSPEQSAKRARQF